MPSVSWEGIPRGLPGNPLRVGLVSGVAGRSAPDRRALSKTNVTGKWERAAAMLGVMHTINQLSESLNRELRQLEMLRCDGRIIL